MNLAFYLCIIILNTQIMMAATERYEKAWTTFLQQLERNPQTCLRSITNEQHVCYKGMSKWLSANGLSVKQAKKTVLSANSGKSCSRNKSPECSDTAESMFVPIQKQSAATITGSMLHGVSLTFPGGIIVNVAQIDTRSVMDLIRIYNTEVMACLD